MIFPPIRYVTFLRFFIFLRAKEIKTRFLGKSLQSMAKCSLLFCFVQIVQCTTEVTPELIIALRCLMRVWLRRELVKYTDVSPAFQAAG